MTNPTSKSRNCGEQKHLSILALKFKSCTAMKQECDTNHLPFLPIDDVDNLHFTNKRVTLISGHLKKLRRKIWPKKLVKIRKKNLFTLEFEHFVQKNFSALF